MLGVTPTQTLTQRLRVRCHKHLLLARALDRPDDGTHPLTFTNWELCTWLGVAVSELVVIGYKGFVIIGCLLSGRMTRTQQIILNIYHAFLYNECNALGKKTPIHTNRIHT